MKKTNNLGQSLLTQPGSLTCCLGDSISDSDRNLTVVSANDSPFQQCNVIKTRSTFSFLI